MKKFLSTVVIGTALVAASMSVQAASAVSNAGAGVLVQLKNYNDGNPVCVAGVAKAISDNGDSFSVNIDNLKRLSFLNSKGKTVSSPINFGKIRSDNQENFRLSGASGVSISPASGKAPKVAMYYKNNKLARLCIVKNNKNTPDFGGFQKKQAVLTKITSRNDNGSKINVDLGADG